MKIVNGIEHIDRFDGRAVISIGTFDAVHSGHRQIIDTNVSHARANNLTSVVIAFEHPPLRMLRPDSAPAELTTPSYKAELIAQSNPDLIVIQPLDREFLSLTAEQFISQVIVGLFRTRVMVEGPTFGFGRDRTGTNDLLRTTGQKMDFELIEVPHHLVALHNDANGTRSTVPVNSTLVRSLITKGDVVNARRCLDRPYRLFGQVVHGWGRGRKMGYPTLNLHPVEQLIPGHGIYAAIAGIDGYQYPAAASIGTNPTFADQHGWTMPRDTYIRPPGFKAASNTDLQQSGFTAQQHGQVSIEAHLLDTTCDLYGRDIYIDYIERIRGMERFDSAEKLVSKMDDDCRRIRSILDSYRYDTDAG